MKLEQSFDIAAPLDAVWNALVDVEHVAPCLPGAEVTGRNDDGSYNGAFTVKIGPTTASYTGKLHMDSVDVDTHTATMHANGTDKRGHGGAKAQMDSIDVDTHTATMHANGTDKRGHGGAKAQIVSRVETVDGKTRVLIDTDYTITGRLARFGRGGMIEDISERLLREFATAAGDPAPAAAGRAARCRVAGRLGAIGPRSP
jgi:carbon monoxide dehydrogenase subunit G